MTDRIDIVRAMREGAAAGTAGTPATECPYRPDGDDGQRLLCTLWMRAHARHRPFPVDFTV